MGWFVGISTRTPTTSISFTATPSSPAPHVSVLPCRARGTPLSTYTPRPGSRTPAGGHPSRARALDSGPGGVLPHRPWLGVWQLLAAQPGLGERRLDPGPVTPPPQR